MARVRRYRQRWLFASALAFAMAIQAGSALTYQAVKPVPPPPPWTLRIDIEGEGTGTVNVELAESTVDAGKMLARCKPGKKACRVEIPRNRWVTLTAVRGDKMTFEGWNDCAPHGEDVLACELRMHRDRHVTATFGKVPEEVNVAWVEPAESDKIKLPQLPKPEDPFEAEKLEEAPVELAMVPLPPPPPELLKPPTPPPPPPPEEKSATPPPPPQPPPDMRMVEVKDENEVKDAPADATHLSDKNRDVAEETAATETNLEKEAEGKSAPSIESKDTTSPEIGGPDDKIAQLEDTTSEWNEVDRTSDHSGEAENASGQIVGEAGDDGEDGEGGTKDPGLMAMRGIGGRGRLLDDRGDGKKRGRKGAAGLHKKLELDDYERIVGKDVAEKERVLARAKMSAKKGRWERKLEAIKSSLENFTPDVRHGNQTALKTRAHPFAVYVARMHRRIHELWGFGFLADLDGKSSGYELNDFDLFTVIELSVNPDGTVYKTTIAKTSGKLTFDVAAIDTVLSAAPYEETPEAIRSVDGRVYLRWGFYRNWRQCGTFNVEPYILTEIPGGAQPIDDGAALAGARGPRPGRGDKPVTPTPKGETATPKPAPVSDNRQASYAANMWVAGFTSGSVARMVRVTALPLKAGGAVAAATAKDLEEVYGALLVESGPMKDWKLLSPTAFTQKTGIPAQVDDGAMVLLLSASKSKFGIVLTPTRSGEYRATEVLR